MSRAQQIEETWDSIMAHVTQVLDERLYLLEAMHVIARRDPCDSNPFFCQRLFGEPCLGCIARAVISKVRPL